MQVTKRDGSLEPMKNEKIMSKLSSLSTGLSPLVNLNEIYADAIQGLYDGIQTSEIDNFLAEEVAARAASHPDYGLLAGRILVNSLQSAKTTPKTFCDAMRLLFLDELVEPDLMMLIAYRAQELQKIIDDSVGYDFDYFGFRTLERSYLLRTKDGVIRETPQYLAMRVAAQIHLPDLDKVRETYNALNEGLATHATPTLFNSGTPNPQLASCFLLTIESDSISGIYNTLGKTADISKEAGGIGLSISNVRAKGAYIKGTGGRSNGIVPMLQVFNNTARYVDQGGNKRKGSFAVYLEPHHPDIFDFLELKKNHGKEEARARDLFYALWISDLFMERVQNDEIWSLFCPSQAPELQDAVGDDYKQLYLAYEGQKAYMRQVRARELWDAILTSQIETGGPFMLYKDACNKKSNQKHLGTIRSSNLCTEIIEYSAPDEIAVCNLLSIALPKFVRPVVEVDGLNSCGFDFDELRRVTRMAVENLNKIIDKNKYPAPEARNSNMRHRPIGIGVQGLADVFAILGYPFDSPQARTLNKNIFEALYFYALEKSCELSKQYGPHESWAGSPASEGVLQFDMWGLGAESLNPTLDWESLRSDIVKHGLRNSLLLAPMPTASTSQILGNNECFEPFTSNMYTRRTLSGEFIITNKHLVRELEALGLWNSTVKNEIIAADGSVQKIAAIPARLRALYQTAYEISQKVIIDMAKDRGAFICQSQSMNLFVDNPTKSKLSSMHFYAWNAGLKTGMYYLRSKAAAAPIKFTLQRESEKACNLDNPNCDSCGA